MKAEFSAAEPGKIECTLKITMPIEDWKALQKQLNDTYPSWKLSIVITKIITHATKHFHNVEETE